MQHGCFPPATRKARTTVLVINAKAKSREYPNGYTKIYSNGVLANQDDLNYRGTPVAPARGSAPFCAGTRDFKSFFKGALGNVAICGKELPAKRIALHYDVMTKK